MKIIMGWNGLPKPLSMLSQLSSPATQLSEERGLTDNILFENEVPDKPQVLQDLNQLNKMSDIINSPRTNRIRVGFRLNT
jgi:hypothetical protein